MKCTFRARSAQASLSCASTDAPADAVTLAEAKTLMLAAVAQFTSVEVVAAAALGAVRDAMKIYETGKTCKIQKIRHFYSREVAAHFGLLKAGKWVGPHPQHRYIRGKKAGCRDFPWSQGKQH